MTVHVTPSTLQNHAVREFKLLIDGEWTDGTSGRTVERVSPAHGVVVTRYAAASVADAEQAILAARRAFDEGEWPRMSGAQRSRILLGVADMIEARADEFALLDTLECGKPISQAEGEIASAIDLWRYSAALARELYGESYNNLGEGNLGVVVREPIGVVSVITPWNFPFLIVSQKLPFALAAGCTCIVKPSELTSGSTVLLGQILQQAGVPKGVVNILVGKGSEIGSSMTGHPAVDMVSFTGSTGVGKQTMINAAGTLKKLSLELGGKNPQIVFPDADMEAFVDAAVFGAYFNAGECCNAGSRLILHADIADDVVARIRALSAEVKVGDPLERSTQVGAIVTEAHLRQISEYVSKAEEAGAVVAQGGGRLESAVGQFMAPTILTGVRPEMAIAREEVFGPVLSVLTFRTIDEAIEIANSIEYGLSASVWSRDIDNCMRIGRRVRAGTVWVNTFMDGFSELPFGGFKQSGLGRELGRHAVQDYTETKTLNVHIGARTNWWMPRR